MELTKRKHPRLKSFDYSQDGCFFITLCTEKKQPLLSFIERELAPDGNVIVRLTTIGQLVEMVLLALPDRYPYASIDKYVIMPTHLHAIIRLGGNGNAISSCPTLMDIICTLKSLSTRIYNQRNHMSGHKIW